MRAQRRDPIGFNTAEGWSRDISEDVASELQYRCDRIGVEVPASLVGFIERHVKARPGATTPRVSGRHTIPPCAAEGGG